MKGWAWGAWLLLLLGCAESSSGAGDDPAGGGASAGTAGDDGVGGSGVGGGSGGSGGGSGGSGAAGSGGSGGGGSGNGGGNGGGGNGGGGSGGGGNGGGGSGGGGGNGGGDPVGQDACGNLRDGPWFEIDYSGAFSATNPAWTFSPTPGWGAADWAPQGDSWPEVWDVYNNISISNDPIGKLALIGPSGVLQIMLGLGGMTSYSHATVCVEGRSVSTNASVIYDVYNPLNSCGVSATMAHDWTVHATSSALQTCLIPNNDFQAIRLEPSGGSSALGVIRATVILHGAVY